MREEGYTLLEMLAALAIIGLAIGGLTQSMKVIRQSEARTMTLLTRERGLSGASRDLGRLFADQGPFRSDDAPGLVGNANAFSFPCAGRKTCGARLLSSQSRTLLDVDEREGRQVETVLPDTPKARFAYSDEAVQWEVWPPTGVRERRLLRTVTITTGSKEERPTVVSIIRLWLEQPPNCAQNTILIDCRTSQAGLTR